MFPQRLPQRRIYKKEEEDDDEDEDEDDDDDDHMLSQDDHVWYTCVPRVITVRSCPKKIAKWIPSFSSSARGGVPVFGRLLRYPVMNV